MLDQSEDAGGVSPRAGEPEAAQQHPGLTGSALADDAEMLKPAGQSEAEATSPKAGAQEPTGNADGLGTETAERHARQESLAQLLEREFAEQDQRLERALAQEQQL